MKFNPAVLRVVARGINDQLANGERKQVFIRKHVGNWLDWYQHESGHWGFLPGDKMFREVEQYRRCPNGIDTVPVEVREPFKSTGNASRLDYALPRTPVKPERGMLTLLRYGRASNGASVLGTAELTSAPFQVRIQQLERTGCRWHDLEKPTALGHTPMQIGSLWPSGVPMFDLQIGDQTFPELEQAPRDFSKRIPELDGLAPRKRDNKPLPRFHMWPSRIPVW